MRRFQSPFLYDLQIVELLRCFSLLPAFEKVAFLHLSAPSLHQKGNDLLFAVSESQHKQKGQDLSMNLKKKYGETN